MSSFQGTKTVELLALLARSNSFSVEFMVPGSLLWFRWICVLFIDPIVCFPWLLRSVVFAWLFALLIHLISFSRLQSLNDLSANFRPLGTSSMFWLEELVLYISGSQPQAILSPEGHLAMYRNISDFHDQEGVRLLVSKGHRGQECCFTSCSAQGRSSHDKEIWESKC